MPAPRYTVGIDLGTSHTVVAYADLAADAPEIRLLPIPQLVGPGQVAQETLLPSLRYHPAPGELDEATLRGPWPAAPAPAGASAAPDAPDAHDSPDAPPAVIGHHARTLGAQVPGRLVASAKSWLSHPGVDRTAAILPWGAPAEVAKVSPVAASASYLAHVRAAWNARFPDAPLEAQQLVLTVPASFDDGARALTVEAARLAGLPKLRLLEEPQAAFHDWLFRHRGDLAAALGPARLVLVCDIGGGTTDLTLIRVEPGPQGPTLTRIGVGDHLMLGGDNMDLALARLLERQLAGGAPLPAARFSQLVQRCRAAKEQLLADGAPAELAVTLLGGGGQLVGAARSATLAREAVERLVVDGFLPLEPAGARPQRRRAGLVEFGLPYPADPAITRHLAAFLDRHAAVARQALGLDAADAPADNAALPVPDTLLLNGGVFRAPALARRVEQVLAAWRGAPLQRLHNDAPDVAVARGAVAHALVRAQRVPGLGAGIGGGSARSYFLVLDGVPDASGRRGPERGLCVLPRGTPEGQEVALDAHTFTLRLGQAVRFHLASSVADTPWAAGALVELGRPSGPGGAAGGAAADGAASPAAAPAADSAADTPADSAAEAFVRLPTLATVLPLPPGRRRAEMRVRLSATVTEVGTLEMHCVSTEDPRQRWLLAFQLRGGDAGPGGTAADGAAQAPDGPAATAHPRLAEAVARIDRLFGSSSADQPDARAVRQLRAGLEQLLGRRECWDLALLRALFDALWARARRRRRSAEHERVWLQLAGWCLRPGMGAPGDAWRVEQLWTLFPQGLQHGGEAASWSAWWTLWRRAAAGLGEAQQLQLLEALAGQLEDIDAALRARAPVAGSYDDMVRLAAALEALPAAHRADTGRWLLQRLARPGEPAPGWWALGRLGARVPLYGSAHQVVPPDVATGWLETLLALDWKAVEPAAFAAAQIARVSGDRARDLAPEWRERVVQRLLAAKAPPAWVRMVQAAVVLDEADQRRSFGEGLPPGLQLVGT